MRKSREPKFGEFSYSVPSYCSEECALKCALKGSRQQAVSKPSIFYGEKNGRFALLLLARMIACSSRYTNHSGEKGEDKALHTYILIYLTTVQGLRGCRERDPWQVKVLV
jgi:hypothetical protein